MRRELNLKLEYSRDLQKEKVFLLAKGALHAAKPEERQEGDNKELRTIETRKNKKTNRYQ